MSYQQGEGFIQESSLPSREDELREWADLHGEDC